MNDFNKNISNQAAGLSRKQVAAHLDVTYARVRSFQKRGLLHASQGKDGGWRYHLTEVERLKLTLRAQQAQQGGDSATGRQAAQAFAMFKQGKTPVEVVIALQLPADTVKMLVREYEQLQELFVLAGPDAQRLRGVALGYCRSLDAFFNIDHLNKIAQSAWEWTVYRAARRQLDNKMEKFIPCNWPHELPRLPEPAGGYPFDEALQLMLHALEKEKDAASGKA